MMRKLAILTLLALILGSSLAGCGTGDGTGDQTGTASGLGRMLGYVPLSFLDEHDIWYTDPGTIKQRFGLLETYTADDIRALPDEQGPAFMNALGALPIGASYSTPYRAGDLIGWDWTGMDRDVFGDTPPWGFNIIESKFDRAAIGQKLLEQGYTQAAYGNETYYRLNDDMAINLTSDLGRMALAQLNRVAMPDDTLVFAPATGIMTGMLDTMNGNVTSVMDDPPAAAIADSLGDALGAVLITPGRLLEVAPGQDAPPFDLPAATSWGRLHDYALVGLGYRDDGTDRYLDIVLYYANNADAAADGPELVSRLWSYDLNTQINNADNVPFTAQWQVGQPVVKDYGGGATLIVANRYLPDANVRVPSLEMLVQIRDLLFLAPDPTPYRAAGDDIINGPTGLNYRAVLQQPGAANPWPPIETATVEVSGPGGPAQVTYRAFIESPAGQTRNSLVTIKLPEPVPFGPDVRLIVEGIDVPEGIAVSQDTDKQSYPGDPVTRVTGIVEVHIAATATPGEYPFQLKLHIGDTPYGEVPCTISVH